ncbi:MAG: hypothetical protein NTY07_15470 [Bacteroidia bacterium]|nr:hypothetical protein [Bacteroidia bacterium]
MKLKDKIQKVSDEKKTINSIVFFWSDTKLRNDYRKLINYIKDKLSNISIYDFEIKDLKEDNFKELNIVVATIDDLNLSDSNKIFWSEKIFIAFSNKSEKGEVLKKDFDNEIVQYPLKQLFPILFAYLAIFAENYLAKTTLIEIGDLSGFDVECLICQNFKGISCEKCIRDLDISIFKPIVPYLPAENCKIFIEGFRITKPSLPLISTKLKEDNKKAYEAIHDLFFSTYKHIPSSIRKYEIASNQNIKIYIDILCKIIDHLSMDEVASIITTDSTFLKSDEYTWFNDKEFIRILAHTKRGLLNNSSLRVSRILVVDFNRYSLEYISKRIIPFYILNSILKIDIYVFDKSSLLKEIKDCDLNFFLKSRIIEINNKMRIGESEILGIIDTKFPFIRILERDSGALHKGYISYIENILNERILLKEPLNNFPVFKELKTNDCQIIIDETLGNWSNPRLFPKTFSQELLDINNDKVQQISNFLNDFYVE